MNKSPSIDFEASLINQVAKPDRKAFRRTLDELCTGCDRGFIVVRLAMRKAKDYLTWDRWDSVARWDLRKSELAQPYVIHIRPLKGLPLCRFTRAKPDEWPRGHQWVGPEEWTLANCEECRTKMRMAYPLVGYYDGTKDFAAIRKKAAGLLMEVRKLRSTRWIHQLIDSGNIRKEDLLHPQTPLTAFDGLLSLESLARSKGPHVREADETELLHEIVEHIHDKTGEWRDRALAEIHDFLNLPHITEDDMKTWRASRRKKQTRGKRPAEG